MAPPIKITTVDVDRTPIWQNIMAREDPQPMLEQIVHTIMKPDSGAAGFGHGPWMHAIAPGGPLRFSALLHKGSEGLEVRAMYPYTESGYLLPLSVQAVERSSDGGTASVLGHVGPAKLGLFDTMSFRTEYQPDVPMQYQLSGIALSLREGTVGPNFAADFCGYGPVRSVGDSSAPADVVEAHAIVEATEPVDFWGIPLTRYLTTIAKTPEQDLTFDFYANDAAVGGRFEAGDRISAHLWLFGFHPQA